jgi:hypothetical protein
LASGGHLSIFFSTLTIKKMGGNSNDQLADVRNFPSLMQMFTGINCHMASACGQKVKVNSLPQERFSRLRVLWQTDVKPGEVIAVKRTPMPERRLNPD